jgi:gliding motility-associated-like protein
MACVSVSGGVGPYIYQWNDPNSQSTACALGLPSGSYLVEVIDASNCVTLEQVNVTDLSGPALVVNNLSDASCNGSTDGTVEMIINGGTTPYQNFQWINVATGNTVGNPNSSILNNQGAGCYSLEVIDDVGCAASQTVCIEEPQALNATFVNVNNASCSGLCNGSTTAIFSGGTAPFSFAWNNGQTTATASNLCAGNYSITITDGNGCTLVSNASISEPAPLTTVQVGVSSTLCSNTCDGAVQIQSLGGTAPYSYFWSPGGANSNTATGLCAGNYAVQTTDANGCQINTSYTVAAPPVLTGTISSVTGTCGLCNGSASLNASGGTTPYSYQWQNGQTATTAVNVCQGSINGIIIDGNGCQLSLNTTVPNIAGPNITGFNSTNLLCNNDNSGTSTVMYTGGTAPLTFNWVSTGQSTSTLSAAPAGGHCVEITDANGCIAYDCTELLEPNVLTGVPDQNATICFGDSTQLWASATGGTGPYTFNWQAPDNNLIGSGPIFVSTDTTHSYCFEVTDANGCVASNSSCIVISVAPPLDIIVSGIQGICLGDSINLTSIPSGGNGSPYAYEWFYADTNSVSIDNSQNLVNYIGSPGTYYLTLNDGCSEEAIDSALITQEPFPTGEISMIDSTVCFPDEIQFMVTSDIGELYEWDFDSNETIDFTSTDTNAVFTFSAAGTFDVSVTISSAAGCEVTITDSAAASVFASPTADFTTYPTTISILIPEVHVTDASSSASTWSWDFTSDNLIEDTLQNTTHTYSDLGIYTIMLAIADSNGCVDTVYKMIEVEEDYQIYVPNTFTPDDDGLNDFFFAEGTEGALEFRMEVYDRWGLLLWEGHRMSAKWDGTYLNVPVQIDTYVWKVEVLFPNDEEQRVYIGHVNVLK